MSVYKSNSVKAGSYSRLSREDGDKLESDSIRNQRDLISDYAARKGISIAEEYIDDGYSGTTFDRPAFQRMMEDVKKKKVNCIIVKDLSRLGRNYIETGRYLEQIFPFLGVRFIAINDHYDSMNQSGDADQIIIPFKNLINDAYCRDISIKIRSQLDVKRKNGKFIGSFAAYGYLKDPEDKNHLVIDEVAAEIVRTIFGLKLNGYSAQRIALQLDEMKILPPLEYKRMSGLNFNSGFRSGLSPHWSVMTVNRILHNELYIGTLVQGKNRKINYKVKESRPVNEDEWIRVEDTHDAIVPPAVFDTVQRLTALDTRTAPDEGSVYILSGFLRCGDCGQNMVRRSATKKGKKYYYYHCSTFKRGDGCSSHNISEGKLMKMVLEVVQKQIGLVLEADEILSEIDRLPQQRLGVKTVTAQLVSLDKEIQRYMDLKAKVYQDMLDGVVTREEFKDINARFTVKLDAAKKAKAEGEKKRDALLSRKGSLRPWVEHFKEYRNVAELSRKLMASLIDSIVVYDSNTVEVHFCYEDEIQEMFEWAAELGAKESTERRMAI
ncbi:MAG: recombinase family protein [Lachnospiraceae bacterium]|nr:recombinase family protein [Lachnospiraceae bacterium]